MKTKIFLFGTLIFSIFLIFIWGSPFIFGDGYGYYHVSKTLVSEGDFVTESEPEYFDYAKHGVSFYDGKYVTVYSVGNALLLSPFMLIANQFDSGTIYSDYFKAFNGHSFADGFAILTAAVIYSVTSLYFIYKTLRVLEFGKKTSIAATLLTYIASLAPAYVFINSSYSHTYEIFAATLFLYFVVTYLRKFDKKNLVFAGIFASLAVLTRSTNIVLILPFVVYLFFYKPFKDTIYFVLSGLPGVAILAIYNYLSYGGIFKVGYTEIWGDKLDFTQFHLYSLLFSDIRGWFVWSPLILISVLTLLYISRKSFPFFLIYTLPVILTILVYSFWENWWAGDSVGQRFFLVLLPYVTVGTANFIKKVSKYPNPLPLTLNFLLLTLVLYSGTLLILYRFSLTTQFGNNHQDYPEVTAEERFSPFDIYDYHLQIMRDSNSLGEYKDKLTENLNGGRSLAMIYAGYTEPIVTIERIDTNKGIIHIVPDPYGETKTFNLTINAFNSYAYILENLSSEKYTQIPYDCSTNYCNIKDLEIIELNPEMFIQASSVTQTVNFYVTDEIKLVDFGK